ncbi:MAG: PHP domain-containing protein, partial [Saprospiraceae bacterium]|nr:PHP domain-containing protein [Saprospiraceae bacterium]
LARKDAVPRLIEEADVVGVVHAHTTYSDGMHGLQEMLPPQTEMNFCGAFRRCCPVLERVEVLVGDGNGLEEKLTNCGLTIESVTEDRIDCLDADHFPFRIYYCSSEDYGTSLMKRSGSSAFLAALDKYYPEWNRAVAASEEDLFTRLSLPYLPPELREEEWGLDLARKDAVPRLIEEADVVGVVHAHTTYSDGMHGLQEMVAHVKEIGYEYLVVTDHSQSAFYANGLREDRLRKQWEEIDQIQSGLDSFRIFKGIESDILADGSLDYDDDVLNEFDVVIASIHSHLNMDSEKATRRLLRAIEHPATRILGHPTGRLLLSRPPYPIDHARIIDACARYGVSIELNANPYRLDLDWSWVPYAIEKGVYISINPDAHSREGVRDIRYGVLAARKGGLTADDCLNAVSATEFAGRLGIRH